MRLMVLLFLGLMACACGIDRCVASSIVSADQYNTLANMPSYNHYRLPTSVKPQKYTLKLLTHLEDPKNFTFVGEMLINVRILMDTNNITLHANNLTIDSRRITLRHLNGNAVRENCVSSTDTVPYHNYYIMYLCEKARANEEYLLTIPFTGILNHKLNGYYRSSYHDKASNETRWLSVTQFEPAYARLAFPCFDEPEYKATFTVILGHHKKYTALSNMPLKQSTAMEGSSDWVWSEFYESVPMSTYLVAYSINDFANVLAETTLQNKVHFRTWARRDAIDQCDYAGIVGPKVLQYYEDIFQIKFPLAKIDQIAIPDFSAGAMENWGLVTYRETALLFKENVSSLANKERVASVIAHELAHQWFGNLVTMRWWTDLWLNEGFATYIASLGVEHISPEWKSYEEESVDNTLAIFRFDALKSSHPVSQPIEHTSKIFEIFDSISYKKGSSVLRMMHMFLGNDSFKHGVHDYLQKHAYGNAEQDDLWATLTDSAHKYRTIPSNFQIKRIMDSWTLQTGYPIILVTRDYDNNRASVSQTRYLLDTQASRSEGQNCWWVPLSYTSQTEADFATTTPKSWLECDDAEGTLVMDLNDMPGKDEWVIFNIQMSGLYKIKYDDRNWNMIIDTLMSDDFSRIHLINRAQLIDDALTLAWSGDQDYDVAMRLIEYLKREREYIPWKAALENLSNVNRILRQTSEYEFFKKYMRKILTPIYVYLHGLNDTTSARMESHSTILHKVLIAGWSCRFEVDDCVPRARDHFRNWRMQSDPDETNPIPTDLRSVVYCTAMRHGNDDDWNFLWARYKNSNVAAERRTIISALGCTREVWLLQRYLQWAFNEESHIRKQDSSFAFGSVARGEVGFHLAKDYFLSNIEFLHNYYEPDSSDLTRLLTPLASQMNSNRDYESIKAFSEQNKKFLQKAEQGIMRALETIRINAQWKENNYIEITDRLRRLVQEDDE